jgi:hypothetical protein
LFAADENVRLACIDIAIRVMTRLAHAKVMLLGIAGRSMADLAVIFRPIHLLRVAKLYILDIASRTIRL